jgi:hypothetical protein
VYGEGVDIAWADAEAGEALAQRLRRSAAAAATASGRGNRRGMERRRGAAAMSHGARVGATATHGGCPEWLAGLLGNDRWVQP